MSGFSKVIWSEGLFLRPQHLQQQDRYLERYIEGRCQALIGHSWGFTEIELERDLLSIGKFGLRRAAGVFPDGTPVRVPDDDPLPAPLTIGPQVRDQVVYLAVPLRRAGSVDVDRSAGTEELARHGVREVEVHDAASASNDTAVLEVGGLRSRFLLSSEVTEAYACLPLAHVLERRADQQVVLDDRFIPTVLDARAAERLATFMTEVVGMLHQKAEALARTVSATGRGGAAEIADFLMLQVINRVEPVLAHVASSGIVHPEMLFRQYLALAGELSTFTTNARRPATLQGYRHERLRESFEPLMAAVRTALTTLLPQGAESIPIESRKFGYSVATVADRSLYANSVFILAARADVPAEELRRKFPAQLKIGPVDKIKDLVKLQLPGVPVHAIPVAPPRIPYHAGFAYFELDQSGDPWRQLAASSGIGLHVAGDFPGLAMEFWALRT